jgi:hypothetical protein
MEYPGDRTSASLTDTFVSPRLGYHRADTGFKIAGFSCIAELSNSEYSDGFFIPISVAMNSALFVQII